MRVEVHKNLTLKNWTVGAVKGNRGRGKKIEGTDGVTLTAPFTFVTSESGMNRTRKGQKDVHAFIIGERVAFESFDGEAITYSPLRGVHFYSKLTGQDISEGQFQFITFTTEGVFAK